MQVSDILSAVSNDVRQLLNTTTDASVMIPWVDRIHKDALHTSLYAYLMFQEETFQTIQDVYNYTMMYPVRRVLLAYDRSFDRVLQNMDDVLSPKQDATRSMQPPVDSSLLSATTMTQWPEYYRRLGSNVLTLFPAPQKVAFQGTMQIQYEIYAPDLVATTDVLTIPNDGKDMIVAGVNSFATRYLKLYDESQMWQADYERMKNGISQR